VGIVAGFAQLLTAPWPLAIRIGIVLALILMAALSIAYRLGIRHGKALPTVDSPPSKQEQDAPAYEWQREDLVGALFVKVSTNGRNVTVCELREDGSLTERMLPRSGEEAHIYEPPWEGSWFFRERTLSIVVNSYHLVLQPSLKGTWTGEESYGATKNPFIGAVVDPRPIVPEEAWVGLRVGSGDGPRNLLVASAHGFLHETDLYEKSGEHRLGAWDVHDDRLRVEVEGWSSEPHHFMPGILVAFGSRPMMGGFALVRARVKS
jgi:hypothetical protein